ncbi:MAG TPA: glutamate--tRNA ligase family protein [Myxococcota bacterium]|nr:glutamate--tRNA ligase family protein [Myxococcota bacterium]
MSTSHRVDPADSVEIGRFAPSSTGPAHPGTLLAALLCWLDARSLRGRIVLRIEDLDPERSRPELADALRRDLEWLGLEWDAVRFQHESAEAHAAALDRLAERGLLYPCRCSRRTLRERAEPAEDGELRYPGTCRGRELPPGGWRACAEPLRVALPAGRIEIADESGLDLSQDPFALRGDPIVRRRDGSVAYQLAGVVDDGGIEVTRVVRGRDLAPSTATQAALQDLLGLLRPRYRHHLLLLEERGPKLAKLHGAVGAAALRRAYPARALCGWLAFAAGLLPRPEDIAPTELLPGFSWSRVAEADRVVRWTGDALVLVASSGKSADT